MSLPLPESLRVDERPTDPNAGLWYDKFFSGWKADFSGPTDGKTSKGGSPGRSEWVSANAKAVGNRALLEEACARIGALVGERRGVVNYFLTDGPFVTGLGREHPVGNGFAWHHTLGVPYLPASSLKGILRAFAREQGIPNADIARIFGADNRQDIAIGSVIFFDAIPSKPVQLKADVMTPHYGPYYQDEAGTTPPADWHDPSPIPFLVVDSNQSCVFACAPRRSANERDRSDCEAVAQWIPGALDLLGAGAKTAVGYGRFTVEEAATRAAVEGAAQCAKRRTEEEALNTRLQGLTPLAQLLERTIAERSLAHDKNAFSAPPLIEDWLDKLEAEPNADAIRRFADLVRAHFVGLLENPHKTKGKKNKPVFNERQRDVAERLNRMLSEEASDS